MTNFTTLLDGYQRFRKESYLEQRERLSKLAEGQNPRVMVIACSDSRVDPTMIFDTIPGQIFVVRNIANLVPPYERDNGRHGVSAALEFAVTQLEVEDILVMGHGQCGGVKASLSQTFANSAPGEGGFIAHWIDLLDDARNRVIAECGSHSGEATEQALEHEAVKVSLSNLRTFPWVAEREARGVLKLHGAWFSIGQGELHRLDEATGEFSVVEA